MEFDWSKMKFRSEVCFFSMFSFRVSWLVRLLNFRTWGWVVMISSEGSICMLEGRAMF